MTLPLAPPAGMRDLLFPESVARRALTRRLVETFAVHGYELVVTPPFEHADVIERGIETVDRRDLLRFVEPESGEVALLRPDITPQIARIVATELAHRPAPHRLAYEGTVVRRRRGRARRHRQIAQAGVELVGVPGTGADVEVISLAARALEASGLDTYRIELGQMRVGREALARVPEAAREDVREALAKKDAATLASTLRAAGVGSATRELLLALVRLYGDIDVLADAERLAPLRGMSAALGELAAVVDQLASEGLARRLGVDLGETRGMSYYTGVRFSVLAHGPGEPVGSGGRYDDLLGRFGAPRPATGFAIDVENLEWAIDARADGAPRHATPARVACFGPDRDRVAAVAHALRSQGVRVSVLPSKSRKGATAFAEAWGHDAVVHVSEDGAIAARSAAGETRALDPHDPADVRALAAWTRIALP